MVLKCVHKFEKPEKTIKKRNLKPKETKRKTKFEAPSVHELHTKINVFSSN